MRFASHSGLWGPGLAVPASAVTQAETAAFLSQTLGLSRARGRWLERLCRESGIERRHTCVSEFVKQLRSDTSKDGLAIDFENPLGNLGSRMERYRREAAPLAVSAARQALRAADLGCEEVTHFVWVTCTGFDTPGADLDMAQQLGLGAGVHRLQIGFMGCQAAVQALRAADAVCRSEPEAVVLLVCAELCTLHFEPGRDDPESLVVSALFSDGVSAALITRRSLASQPRVRLLEFASQRFPEHDQMLTWRLGEPAFRMGLSRHVPAVLADRVPDFASKLLPRSVPRSRLAWAIHPGGRAILDAMQEALDLSDAGLEPSRRTLAGYGNMSSATLLFVLDRLPPAISAGVGLAFGPGLSLEGFRWVSGG